MKRNSANLKRYKQVCKEIWQTREHKCEDCGCPIGEWDMELGENVPKYYNFDHIDGRETEEKCFDKDNIKLRCFKDHANKGHGQNEQSTWLK